MRRGTRLSRAGAALAAAALVAVAGCTPGGGPPAAAPAAPDSRTGGTLTVAVGRPGSVDPLDAYEPSGLLVARTMCDTLVELDIASGEVRPGIAESWSVLDGGRQLSFRLRESARFSDGRRVRAADVVDSLTRAASPAFAGRSAALLRRIAGWDELREEVGPVGPRQRRLTGVRALNASTVEVNLVAPDADAVRLFTHPVTAPVSSAATRADPDAVTRAPVCSGPYRLARPWSPADDAFTLERVAGYVGRSTARTRGGAGYADRIEFVVAGTTAAADPDITVHPAAPSGEPTVADTTRHRVAGPGVEYVAFPAGTASPYRDVRVRRALLLALDLDQLVEAATPGQRVAARAFLPPALLASTGAPPCPAPGPAAPAEVRRLLAAAGVDPSGLPIRLTVNDDGANVAVAEELARQWRAALGMTVEVETVAFPALLARATTGAGITGPTRVSWAAPFPGVDAHLAPLFSSGAADEANFGRWEDPEWDEILQEEARRATDPDDRRLAHRRLHERLCQKLPALPLTVGLAAVDVRDDRVATALPWVDPLTGEPPLREMWRRA